MSILTSLDEQRHYHPSYDGVLQVLLWVYQDTGYYGLGKKFQYRIVWFPFKKQESDWADIGRLDSFQTKLTNEQKSKLTSMSEGWMRLTNIRDID